MESHPQKSKMTIAISTLSLQTDHFTYLVYGWMALAILLIPIQLIVTAPYGRHTRTSWGPMLPNKWAWVLMELVSPMVFAGFFLLGENSKTWPMWIFFGLWMAHYLNRSIIYPLRTKTTGKQMPLVIALSAAVFNMGNGYLNGHFLGSVGPIYAEDWLLDPRFIGGLSLFLVGAIINIWSDNYLLSLRKPGETGYRLPNKGLFRWVSCPNLMGEILEWAGFAVLCWNLPALSFAVWTAANLIPRAISHHRWYRTHFAEYPARRKAIIPWVL